MQSERYGVLLEDGTLRFVRELPGPIERVWDYLADPEKRSRWLAGGARPGSEPGETFELSFDNSSLTPHEDRPPEKYRDLEGGVSFNCELIACEAPRLLRFSWPGANGGNTEVTIRLSPVGDRVRFELEHRRIRSPDDLVGTAAGWHVHLGILEDRLNSLTPGPFWSAHEDCEMAYLDRLSDHLRRMRDST